MKLRQALLEPVVDVRLFFVGNPSLAFLDVKQALPTKVVQEKQVLLPGRGF